MKFLLTFSLSIIFFNIAISQELRYLIDSIHLKGNVKTKNYIVYNELDFKSGDSISLSDIDIVFERNTDRLLGTALFVNANFNVSDVSVEKKSIDIIINLHEAWFIYPIFYFELTDRNLSEWIYDHNADLNRINIILNLQHNNLTGNKDKLELKFQTGITKKWEISYFLPYINKNNDLGLFFNALHKTSKEITYNTIYNKLAYYRSEDLNMLRQIRISAGITLRSSLRNHHILKLSFYDNKTNALVAQELNPKYFKNPDRQRYLDIHYTFYHDKLNYKIYPTSGYFWYVEIEKAGLGIFKDLNQLILWSGFEKHIPLFNRFYSSFNFEAKKSVFNSNPPYFNNRSLGYYDRFMNGYELYVIDGEDYLYLKTSQKYNFMSGDLNLNKLINLRQFRHIPYDFYFTLNFDAGYVNNNTNFALNNFTNRMLYGYGAGLDILLYHNLFRFTYSINHLGEDGFYFHLKTIF